MPAFPSLAVLAAPPPQRCTHWRVVIESVPRGDERDAQAQVRVFDDYEAAWQCVHDAHAERTDRIDRTHARLVDPQGRVLIDTHQERPFAQADRELLNLPSGTYRWHPHAGRYELLHAEHEAHATAHGEARLAGLLGRRSVSPKRLGRPGPTLSDLDLMLQAALRAPDHGGLHPWRVIEFRDDQRAALAECFEQEKLRRDPLASAFDVRRARDHAFRPPVLLAFVVSPQPRTKVPMREQWLAGGAALGNLLNAAHQLGFGAILLSGERCFDVGLLARLAIGADEYLAGFISIGRVVEEPPAARNVLSGRVWSCWSAEGREASTDLTDHRGRDA